MMNTQPKNSVKRGMQHSRLHSCSREELETHFVRLQEENLHLKNRANKQADEMKKLGTKLKKMANDQDRLAQLVMGRGQVRVVDQELDVLVEDLQQRLQALERPNEELKQREHIARQQRCLHNGGNSVNAGQQKPQNNVSSCYPKPPKNVRRMGGGKPLAGLLEEARAEISSLKKSNLLQQNRIKELEGALKLLQDQLREKEVEHEKKLLQIHQQEASKIWSNVENNVTLTSLQKQITDKSNTVAELQERLLQTQKSHRSLKANYQAAVLQMNDLMAQLDKEKEKSLQLEKHLQVPGVDNDRVHGLHQQLAQVKEERDVLRERISKLHKHTCEVCQAQTSQLTQLQTALRAELVGKTLLLSKLKWEEETRQELTAQVSKLKRDCLEQQQQLAELSSSLGNYAGEGEYSAEGLSEALLLVKTRRNRKETESGTGDVVEVEDRANAMRELQEAHAKTMQELQKSKKMLSVERQMCKDFKQKLEDVARWMTQDQARAKQKHQVQLAEARTATISTLEAQLRRPSTPTSLGRPELIRGGGTGEEPGHPPCGESLIELQIVGARFSSSALKLLGGGEPATFCTYVFFRFAIHSTPVARGPHPTYCFTSEYIVKMEEDFLDYVSSCTVLVELHQRLVGCEWRTMATAQLPLQQLLERDGRAQGSAALVSVTGAALAFGSLDYCIRLKLPATEEPSGASGKPSSSLSFSQHQDMS